MAFGRLGARGGFGDMGASLGGKVSPAFTPAQFGANLVGWWKADAGVFSDAGVTPAANNATVQQWNDQSGNGNHLVQATAGARPTFLTAGFNGAPSVTFSAASSTRLATAVNGVAIGAGKSTTWTVAARENAASQGFARLIGYVASSDTQDFASTHSFAPILGVPNNSDFEAFQGGNEYILTGIGTNIDYRLSVSYDGANINPYVNSVLGTPRAATWTIGSPGTIMVGADLTLSGTTIQSSAVFWDGPVSELVVVNRVLTTNEINQLEDYLRRRWNAAVPRLPSNYNLIVDSDNAADCGDVGAIQTALALHKNGETNFGLFLANSANSLSAEAARVICAANGVTPTIGAYQGSLSTIVSASSSSYTSQVVSRFGTSGNTRGTYADAVTAARTYLVSIPNASGIWASVGFGPNLAGLLASAADGISPLTGSQLFAAKIARLVIQGGDYPNSGGSAEFNFAGDPADWNTIFATKPAGVPTYLIGVTFPSGIISGPAQNGGALVSPSYYAYTLAGDNQGGGVFTRPVWDQLAVMFGVRGDSDGNLLVLGQKGTNVVNASTALNTWTAGSDAGSDSYLFQRASTAIIQTAINALVAPIL